MSAPERAGSRSRDAALALLGVGLVVGLWYLAVARITEPGSLLARFGPVDAVRGIGLFLDDGGVGHLAVSLRRLAVGVLIASAGGVVLGGAIGLSRTARAASSVVVQFVRMISPLAWTPVAIAVFGVGDAPVHFLIAIAAIWPVVLATAAGVRSLDAGWLEVAQSLGASRWERLRAIVVPGVRADVATGIRVALGTAWIVLVPAEMLGVDSGVGYAILDARDRLSYDELMGIVLLIGAVGFIIDAASQRVLGSRRRRTRRGSSPTEPLAPALAGAGA